MIAAVRTERPDRYVFSIFEWREIESSTPISHRSITSAVDEERQRELEQQQLFDDLFASDGEDDTNGSAGYVHNTRDTSELDEAENEYNDLLVDYEELFDFDE